VLRSDSRRHEPDRQSSLECASDAVVSPETARGRHDEAPRLIDAVKASVLAHGPTDDREAEAKQRILFELDRIEDPFDEKAGPIHLTGSAVVAGPRGTILHLHKRLGRWMQTGGHLEPGEMPYDAALRESEEETGLELSHPDGGPRLLHLDVHPAADGHTHLDMRYLLIGSDAEPSPPPGESPIARWFSWNEAHDRSDEALAGALLAAERQPEVSSWVSGEPSES
jgi:8-oxo-dGTP pyrophosphatase MutT (NUDIX family)